MFACGAEDAPDPTATSVTAPPPAAAAPTSAAPSPTASTAAPTATAVPPTATHEPSTAPVAVFPYSVTDSNGNEVVFDSAPERIVAYDGGAVDALFAIGEGDRVVGTHEYVTSPDETADIPKVGDAFSVNIEEVVALEPDLVFIFFPTFVEDMERAGMKVLFIESLNNDFLATADMVRMWGRITGAVDEAEAVATDFEDRVQAIADTMAPISATPTVFQDVGGMWTPGDNTLIGEVFELLRLDNIASDVDGYAQISPEVVVERNPMVVITTDVEGFKSNPAFAKVSAVENDRVFSLPSDDLSQAGPRFVRGIEDLAKMVYPQIFE